MHKNVKSQTISKNFIFNYCRTPVKIYVAYCDRTLAVFKFWVIKYSKPSKVLHI